MLLSPKWVQFQSNIYVKITLLITFIVFFLICYYILQKIPNLFSDINAKIYYEQRKYNKNGF